MYSILAEGVTTNSCNTVILCVLYGFLSNIPISLNLKTLHIRKILVIMCQKLLKAGNNHLN